MYCDVSDMVIGYVGTSLMVILCDMEKECVETTSVTETWHIDT
jgi:hypothetical protein